MENIVYLETPIGLLGICDDGLAITQIFFGKAAGAAFVEGKTPVNEAAATQLGEYFAGKRRCFDLPLAPKGTAFQRRVWEQLCRIPYGETRSYGDIARLLDNPKACRAVGMANHNNPIAIVIPCHRVVGAKGNLTGYAAGLPVKEYLLRLEGDDMFAANTAAK